MTQQQSAEELYRLAVSAVEREHWSEAEALLRRFLDAHPDHASGHHLLGRCLRARGDLETALLLQRRSCELDPGMGWNWFAAGEVLMEQQSWHEAAASFARAIHALPSEGWMAHQLQQARTAMVLGGGSSSDGLARRAYHHWIQHHEPSLVDPLTPLHQPFWLFDANGCWHALHAAGAALTPHRPCVGNSAWPQEGWLVLLGQGSVLRSGALQSVEAWLQQALPWDKPEHVVADVASRRRGRWMIPDVIYADEDRIDDQGVRHDPWFKPGWVPESFWSSPWLGGLSLWRLSWLQYQQLPLPPNDEAGRFRWQLRALELQPGIEHCPLLLSHQQQLCVDDRVIACLNDQALALHHHLEQLGEGSVDVRPLATSPGCYQLQWARPRTVTCSVIIPTRDRSDLLGVCLQSLLETTALERSSGIALEVLVVDNASVESETFRLFDQWEQQLGDCWKLLRCGQPFNWSRLNNRAATQASGELLLCLNNDIEARQLGWLESMVSQALRSSVGCVGANLLYPDGTLQHGGVVIGCHRGADHAYRGLPLSHAVHRGRSGLLTGWGAVTGACLMLRRELLERCGGFDEGLPVEFNDVDLCLKLQTLGYRHVIPADAVLIHHESQSRDAHASSTAQRALERMQQRWPGRFRSGSPWWPQQCELNCSDGRPLGLVI